MSHYGDLLINTGTTANIFWTTPQEVTNDLALVKVRIYRSLSENGIYNQIDEINATMTSYTDPAGTRNNFYLVAWTQDPSISVTPYNLTWQNPTPREMRMIDYVRRSMPPIVAQNLRDEDYIAGLNFALQIFNSHPPQTEFTLTTLPVTHEYFIMALAQLTALASRYLLISIKDFNYSDQGFSLDLNRGEKVINAIEQLQKVFSQYLPLVKLDFGDEGVTGIGTVQLPLSMGGSVTRGLLNTLDIFTAIGR